MDTAVDFRGEACLLVFEYVTEIFGRNMDNNLKDPQGSLAMPSQHFVYTIY